MVSLAGWYKSEPVLNADLYLTNTDGTLPGEGAAMFLVNNSPTNAVAYLRSIKMVNSTDENFVKQQMEVFLKENLQEGEEIDLFLQGENGDKRLQKYYTVCEVVMKKDTTIGRYKHAFGEFQTVPALALWLACYAMQKQSLPNHFIKRSSSAAYKRILLYNNYQGMQHSFTLVEQAM